MAFCILGLSSMFRSSRRHALWLAMLAVLAILFRQVIIEGAKLSLSVDHYSHLIFIPFLSAFLLYRHRGTTFSNTARSLGVGVTVAFLSVPALIFAASASGTSAGNGYLFARGLALFVLVLASFIFCYGVKAFRSAAFPLLFLFLAVPLPAQVVNEIIVLLQKGSAAACDVLFSMMGVPFLRRGDVFNLPNLTIAIAPECSGIRSSMALFITTLLAAHLMLRSWPKKVVLVFCVIPLVVAKNGLRIVTLSLLTVYVDHSFLTGWLHTSGGIVFYLFALAVIGILLGILAPKPAEWKKAASATTVS